MHQYVFPDRVQCDTNNAGRNTSVLYNLHSSEHSVPFYNTALPQRFELVTGMDSNQLTVTSGGRALLILMQRKQRVDRAERPQQAYLVAVDGKRGFLPQTSVMVGMKVGEEVCSDAVYHSVQESVHNKLGPWGMKL